MAVRSVHWQGFIGLLLRVLICYLNSGGLIQVAQDYSWSRGAHEDFGREISADSLVLLCV